MGAGLPERLIKQRVRRWLQRIAASVPTGVYRRFEAFSSGPDEVGREWLARVDVWRASNGESGGHLQIDVWTADLKGRAFGIGYYGTGPGRLPIHDLKTALRSYALAHNLEP